MNATDYAWYFKNKKTIMYKRNIYRQKNPWIQKFEAIQQRCNNPKNKRYYGYGGRGIEMKITKDELKYLWNRDRAYLMKKSSIDRINNDGNYELSNCRFIELSDNVKRNIKHIYNKKDFKPCSLCKGSGLIYIKNHNTKYYICPDCDASGVLLINNDLTKTI